MKNFKNIIAATAVVATTAMAQNIENPNLESMSKPVSIEYTNTNKKNIDKKPYTLSTETIKMEMHGGEYNKGTDAPHSADELNPVRKMKLNKATYKVKKNIEVSLVGGKYNSAINPDQSRPDGKSLGTEVKIKSFNGLYVGANLWVENQFTRFCNKTRGDEKMTDTINGIKPFGYFVAGIERQSGNLKYGAEVEYTPSFKVNGGWVASTPVVKGFHGYLKLAF